VFDRERAQQLLIEEFRVHPDARLFDYYKLLFQGVFGSEHLTNDERSARQLLSEELESAESFDQPLWSDISYVYKVFRVSLKVIRMNIVSVDDYTEAFLDCPKIKSTFTSVEWAREWQGALELMTEMRLPILADRNEIARTLEAASLASPMHHSKHYKERYNPHYRILTREQFSAILQFPV